MSNVVFAALIRALGSILGELGFTMLAIHSLAIFSALSETRCFVPTVL